MHFTVDELVEITGGTPIDARGDIVVQTLSTDSRTVRKGGLFVALRGEHVDGHDYLSQALARGAALAMVSQVRPGETGPLLLVKETLWALGQIGAAYRARFRGRVGAITGSNGKTILKSMLSRVVAGSIPTATTRGSYNSRLGVPLALLDLPLSRELWLTEAGVSMRGDMARIEPMLRPDFGILTNIGLAHLAGFGDRSAIAQEKMTLFHRIPPSGWVLLPKEEPLLEELAANLRCRVVWLSSSVEENHLQGIPALQEIGELGTALSMRFLFPGESEGRELLLNTPSKEIARDLELAVVAASLLNVHPETIVERLKGYEGTETRMEIWHSPKGVLFINDACSSDPISVESALRSLARLAGRGRRIFLFGGMGELGERSEEQHAQVGRLAAQHKVNLLIAPRLPQLEATVEAFTQGGGHPQVVRYQDGQELLTQVPATVRSGDAVLLKGPRLGTISRLAPTLYEAIAPNRLVVDFAAILENIKRFRAHMGEEVQILAMVKALAYGSDMMRLALELERAGVEFLGVSTPDEGAQLRRLGTSLPIVVMITAPDELDKLVRHNLTPVLNSLHLAHEVSAFAQEAGVVLPVHVKIDTGMGRMGVPLREARSLFDLVAQSPLLKVTGIMTHLGSADDPAWDANTEAGLLAFSALVDEAKRRFGEGVIAHSSATSGAIRFPWARFDMVRIGLGLYGLYPRMELKEILPLIPAVSLISRIVDVKIHPKGATLGYGATYTVPQDGVRVGLLPLGYHDGIPWRLSNRGSVVVHGVRAPIVGRVSMDSLMIDITDIPQAQKGSDVLLFGNHHGDELRPEEVAAWANTIVYELLARIGPRVQRIFKT